MLHLITRTKRRLCYFLSSLQTTWKTAYEYDIQSFLSIWFCVLRIHDFSKSVSVSEEEQFMSYWEKKNNKHRGGRKYNKPFLSYRVFSFLLSISWNAEEKYTSFLPLKTTCDTDNLQIICSPNRWEITLYT